MATNTFKRFVKASIGSPAVGNATTIYTVPSGKTSIVIGCLLVNKTATDATVSMLNDTSITADADTYFCFSLTVPKNSSVELALGKCILYHDSSNGDVVKAFASAATTIDVHLSVLEDVN